MSRRRDLWVGGSRVHVYKETKCKSVINYCHTTTMNRSASCIFDSSTSTSISLTILDGATINRHGRPHSPQIVGLGTQIGRKRMLRF